MIEYSRIVIDLQVAIQSDYVTYVRSNFSISYFKFNVYIV